MLLNIIGQLVIDEKAASNVANQMISTIKPLRIKEDKIDIVCSDFSIVDLSIKNDIIIDIRLRLNGAIDTLKIHIDDYATIRLFISPFNPTTGTLLHVDDLTFLDWPEMQIRVLGITKHIADLPVIVKSQVAKMIALKIQKVSDAKSATLIDQFNNIISVPGINGKSSPLKFQIRDVFFRMVHVQDKAAIQFASMISLDIEETRHIQIRPLLDKSPLNGVQLSITIGAIHSILSWFAQSKSFDLGPLTINAIRCNGWSQDNLSLEFGAVRPIAGRIHVDLELPLNSRDEFKIRDIHDEPYMALLDYASTLFDGDIASGLQDMLKGPWRHLPYMLSEWFTSSTTRLFAKYKMPLRPQIRISSLHMEAIGDELDCRMIADDGWAISLLGDDAFDHV